MQTHMYPVQAASVSELIGALILLNKRPFAVAVVAAVGGGGGGGSTWEVRGTGEEKTKRLSYGD